MAEMFLVGGIRRWIRRGRREKKLGLAGRMTIPRKKFSLDGGTTNARSTRKEGDYLSK
jgi:hypothetical protein